jgi:hypothetical protein
MNQIDFILYAQHGWADTSKAIAKLANGLATSNTMVVTPNLGYLKTWIRIEPLINQVETIVTENLENYPEIPLRIIGHSMGGLIWLEILDRHPQWWSKIHSLVLVGSPIGGADLARIIDPFEIGIGIAKDLGKNRRAIAEKIAQNIPTLVIAGDLDNGSDRTVTVEATKFAHSQFISVTHISHRKLKNHPDLIPIIQKFWANPVITKSEETLTEKIIRKLRSIPGITDGHRRGYTDGKTYLTFPNNLRLRTWKNSIGIDHIFLVNDQEECLYSGFVGWIHSQDLWQNLEQINQEFAQNKLLSNQIL